MLVVQVVTILWTKRTRGAPRSRERVALPRAFPILTGAGPCIVQHHRIAEWETFSPTLVKSESLPSVPGRVEILRISREAGGRLILGFLGTPAFGRPKRHPIEKALAVASGDYVRLTVNARHTSYSGQHYSETTYNVACGEDVATDRFLLGPPDRELDLRANLF